MLDPLLAGLPPERQATLVTVREPPGLRFDIRLQGDRETVFTELSRPATILGMTARTPSGGAAGRHGVTDLFWPGDHRPGELFSDASFVAAMVRVERAWLTARGIPADLRFGGTSDELAVAAEDGGNPVIPLLAALRSQGAPDRPARRPDQPGRPRFALALCLRDAATRIRADLDAAVATLAATVDRHRHTPMAARTLTQHAVPITFGLKAAAWFRVCSTRATGCPPPPCRSSSAARPAAWPRRPPWPAHRRGPARGSRPRPTSSAWPYGNRGTPPAPRSRPPATRW